MASVIVMATGLLLVGKDMRGAEAGLILSFAVVASHGPCSAFCSMNDICSYRPLGLFYLLECYRHVTFWQS